MGARDGRARTADRCLGPAAGAGDHRAAIPAHTGLGSGTQLALAWAWAWPAGRPRGHRARGRRLCWSAARRSGIGIGAFQHGGFILDGGSAADGAPPPVTARLPFPDHGACC